MIKLPASMTIEWGAGFMCSAFQEGEMNVVQEVLTRLHAMYGPQAAVSVCLVYAEQIARYAPVTTRNLAGEPQVALVMPQETAQEVRERLTEVFAAAGRPAATMADVKNYIARTDSIRYHVQDLVNAYHRHPSLGDDPTRSKLVTRTCNRVAKKDGGPRDLLSYLLGCAARVPHSLVPVPEEGHL